jgi:FkbM family methyltransferase
MKGEHMPDTPDSDPAGTSTSAGDQLRRLLQASMGWPAWATPITWTVLIGGLVLLRAGWFRNYRPRLRTVHGIELEGRPTDSMLSAVVFYRGLFEPVLTRLIEQLVQPGDLCVDAGANVGYFTLLMANRAGPEGQVLAIEAAPRNLQRLQRNIARNGWADRVRVLGAAYTNAPGPIAFYISRRNDMHCRLAAPPTRGFDRWLMGGARSWRVTTVPTTTLRQALGAGASRVGFIKLDIEGAEHLVVQDILAHCTHPSLRVAMEAKAPHIRAALEPFEAAGFLLYDLHNDYRWLYNRSERRATPLAYSQAYLRRSMVDVLLSRQPLPADCLQADPAV